LPDYVADERILAIFFHQPWNQVLICFQAGNLILVNVLHQSLIALSGAHLGRSAKKCFAEYHRTGIARNHLTGKINLDVLVKFGGNCGNIP
jgi:hypothetical protein